MSNRKRFNLFLYILFFSCTVILKSVRCSENILTNEVKTYSNYSLVTSLYNSFITCMGPISVETKRSNCLKEKFYAILERMLRDKFDKLFTKEEQSELSEYKPVLRKIALILEKDNEGPWLDKRIFNHLKLLLTERTDDAEGRKKKNKGLDQILRFSLISGITVMVPLIFKAILAMATKALIAGKVAIILSTLLYFNKISHQDTAAHETTIRRHIN